MTRILGYFSQFKINFSFLWRLDFRIILMFTITPRGKLFGGGGRRGSDQSLGCSPGSSSSAALDSFRCPQPQEAAELYVAPQAQFSVPLSSHSIWVGKCLWRVTFFLSLQITPPSPQCPCRSHTFPGLVRCFRFWQRGWSATGSLPQPEAEVSKDTELFNDFPGSN